jgi:uncharacterized protein YciI
MGAELFVITHHRGSAWEPGVPYPSQSGIEGHIGFMRSLDERGLMVLGGPFADEGDAVGMAIVRAASQQAAEALAAEDPSLEIGLIEARVRPWRAMMGSALED